MPSLRFTRDKRGYETTSLVHVIRRQGRAKQRILYWFRTPPGVRVGRPALDQEAIRWIEEHNPDIEFDWPAILEAQPAPSGPPIDDSKGRRPRRGTDRADRGRPPTRPESGHGRPQPAPAVSFEPLPPVGDAVSAVPEPLEIAGPERAGSVEPEIPDAPGAEEPTVITIGPEQLIRLRARYAELQARITERGGEAARVEELRAQAESLNPDTWVTQDERRQGLEAFESTIRDLRAALGLRRRRRSGRGGRRRRRPEAIGDGQKAIGDRPEAIGDGQRAIGDTQESEAGSQESEAGSQEPEAAATDDPGDEP